MCCCLSSAAVSGFHRLSRRETDLARPPGWGAAASSGGSCHGPAQGLSSEAERREEREPPLQEALTLSLSRRLCRRLHRFPALGDGSSWRACGTALRLVPPRRSAGPETLFFRDRRLRVSFAFGGRSRRKGFAPWTPQNVEARPFAAAPWRDRGLRPGPAGRFGYLVDPASSHMLVSKTKPCMSEYKRFCTVKLRMAH